MKHAFHLLLVFIGLSLAVTAAPAKPNIVIIFTDDQGYADLACYGNTKNKTPRLDQLAKEGTRITSFYSQTVCGPSRSALLTGRQPIRSGGWGMPRDMGGLIKLYTDKSIDYLKNKRDPKKPFVLYLAHTMMHTIIDASPKFRGKSKGGLYGDVVEEFDFETGRLLDTLDELKLADNTLIIYTSDNGPWNQDKYTKRKKGHPAGAIFWGEAGPLRNGKGSPYEAGYRLPCIVRWPGKVPAGRVNDAVFATIDFMPTFANLCGFALPKDRHIDGIDQTDLLLGKRETGREFFYFNKAGVRKGKWKYLRANAHFHGYAVDDQRPKAEELYDLEADLGERNNLAQKHPQLLAELRALTDQLEAKK